MHELCVGLASTPHCVARRGRGPYCASHKRSHCHHPHVGTFCSTGRVLGQSPRLDPPRPVEPDATKAAGDVTSPQRELERAAREITKLSQAQAAVEGGPEIDRLKAQVELQQKQIDVLLQMTRLLADQMKKQGPPARPSRSCRSRSQLRSLASSKARFATRNWLDLATSSSSDWTRRLATVRPCRPPSGSSSARTGIMSRR